jgi:myosin heavy subunit
VNLFQTLLHGLLGPILVALNPFKSLPIYSEEHKKLYKYEEGKRRLLPPHVFGTADAVYQAMMRDAESGRGGSLKNPAILISGESGAGKTEVCGCR